MTDINRRGFLQLLGASAAVAVTGLPKQTIEEIESIPSGISQIEQGLYIRNKAGIVKRLGSISTCAISQETDYFPLGSIAYSTTVPRIFKKDSFNLEATLLNKPEDIKNIQGLIHSPSGNGYEVDDFSNGDILAIFGYKDLGSDMNTQSVITRSADNSIAIREDCGYYIVAMKNAFVKNFEMQFGYYNLSDFIEVRMDFEAPKIMDHARYANGKFLIPPSETIKGFLA